jgi:diacylglycerol kinase (ATP)
MATAVLSQIQPAPLAPVAPPSRPRRLRSLAPQLLVVANANASGLVRRPELLGDAVSALRSLGARVEPRLTATTEELAATLHEAGRRVVLLGGDGSLHAAANVAGPKPELAILPAGRANNVARSLGIPVEIARAARLAVEGTPHSLDLIAARTETSRYLAVEGVSAGFHARARANYHGTNSADFGAGLKAGLGALTNYEQIAIGLETDGTHEVVRIGQLFVANLPLFGFGLRVAPGADPEDGLLDVVTLQARTRRRLLSLIPHLRRGTHIGLPGVRHVRARRIRIATGGRSPIIADTTTLDAHTVELTVQRAAIEVVGAAA